jgi:P27 family predicted phage terminase small subunit
VTRSTAKKLFSGTRRSDRTRRLNGADVLKSLPPAPDHLPQNARECWERLGHLAISAGTITQFDTELLALAARTAATCDELELTIRSQGSLIESRGTVKANPACAALDRNRILLLKLLDALGLSPAARERLSIEARSDHTNKFAMLKHIE